MTETGVNFQLTVLGMTGDNGTGAAPLADPALNNAPGRNLRWRGTVDVHAPGPRLTQNIVTSEAVQV